MVDMPQSFRLAVTRDGLDPRVVIVEEHDNQLDRHQRLTPDLLTLLSNCQLSIIAV
jgi:hypothetical protein